MEQPEIISISHARDIAVQTPSAEERRLEVVGAGDAAQVVFVEREERERRGRGEGGEDDGLR